MFFHAAEKRSKRGRKLENQRIASTITAVTTGMNGCNGDIAGGPTMSLVASAHQRMMMMKKKLEKKRAGGGGGGGRGRRKSHHRLFVRRRESLRCCRLFFRC